MEKRTKEEIDQEYGRCAALIGDRQFKLRLIDTEIRLLFEKMVQLNAEALDLVPPPTPPVAAT